jgi:putative spermidine/putrescine transport system ATP-binding protein
MAYMELVDLCKSFSGHVVLRNIALSVAEGELVSLLGPSGCGKTTTLRIVAGFEKPDSGAIRLGGRDILKIAPSRRGIGIVFQNYALFPHLSAWNNIAFGLKMAGRSNEEISQRVAELLDMVGLREVSRKYPHEMSGGQQQRIALARAIAIKPALLLLDEPLSALDAVVRVSLRDEIRRIQASLGMTTLYVTHDQEEALAISDRIVVMRDGGIEQIGSSEEIYSQPASKFVAGFIGKMNQLSGRVIEPTQGHVECGGYRLRVPVNETVDLARESTVAVLVRPEAISIGPADPTPENVDHYEDNRINALVEVVTFLGSVKRIALKGDSQRFIVDVSTASSEPIHRNDVVLLSFPVDACRVLVDSSASENGGGNPDSIYTDE